MKTTLTQDEFVTLFRSVRPDQFSREALRLLFDYLEEIDPDLELDIVGICCDFAESTPDEVAEDYDILPGDAVQYLEGQGVFVGETPAETIVYHQF